MRPYQEASVLALMGRSGVIVSPARSGKTWIAARALHLDILRSRRPARVLWLAGTNELLAQAKEALGLLRDVRGSLKAWIRTPMGLGGLPLDTITHVVVDEVHHASAQTWKAAVLACVNARHRWGFTATPRREDGQWQNVEKLIGPILHVVTREDVGEAVGHVPCSVQMLPVGTRGDLEAEVMAACFDDVEERTGGKFEALWRKVKWKIARNGLNEKQAKALRREVENKVIYQEAIRAGISCNETRHMTMALAVNWHAARGDSVLCLVKTKEQGEGVLRHCNGAKFTFSQDRNRIDTVRAFVGGGLRCLIATSLADEGFDAPCANVLVMGSGGRGISKVIGTGGNKSVSVKLEQRALRVLTPDEGKEEALIYDLWDWGIPILEGQSRARQAGYRKLGFNVEVQESVL